MWNRRAFMLLAIIVAEFGHCQDVSETTPKELLDPPNSQERAKETLHDTAEEIHEDLSPKKTTTEILNNLNFHETATGDNFRSPNVSHGATTTEEIPGIQKEISPDIPKTTTEEILPSSEVSQKTSDEKLNPLDVETTTQAIIYSLPSITDARENTTEEILYYFNEVSKTTTEETHSFLNVSKSLTEEIRNSTDVAETKTEEIIHLLDASNTTILSSSNNQQMMTEAILSTSDIPESTTEELLYSFNEVETTTVEIYYTSSDISEMTTTEEDFPFLDILDTTTEEIPFYSDVLETTTEEVLGKRKVSEKIVEILEHFKQPNPEGIPGADIPDPCPVPDRSQSLAIGTIYFSNTALYGGSKFRILYITADINKMEISGAMVIDKLQTRGRYAYRMSPFQFFNNAEGVCSGDFTVVKMMAQATLSVELDGKLKVQDIFMNVTYDTVALNFENLGVLGNMIQGASSFLFESAKPYLIKEACVKLRADMNAKLDEVAGDTQFPNTLSPLDMILVDARNKMQEMGLDPYKVKDYNAEAGLFSVSLSETWLTGISSFHRIGNIILKIVNTTVIADFEVGTKKVEGSTKWDVSAAGMINNYGTASFSIEYISGRIVIAQPLDTRNQPELKEFHLELGNIQSRCDGAGLIDYITEFSINILPNLVRYQIMETLENSLKLKLQNEISRINVEELIKQQLPKIDEIQKTEFTLSSLRVKPKSTDDEFFNF